MPTDAFDVFASSSVRSPSSHPPKGCEASVALTGPTLHDLVARICEGQLRDARQNVKAAARTPVRQPDPLEDLPDSRRASAAASPATGGRATRRPRGLRAWSPGSSRRACVPRAIARRAPPTGRVHRAQVKTMSSHQRRGRDEAWKSEALVVGTAVANLDLDRLPTRGSASRSARRRRAPHRCRTRPTRSSRTTTARPPARGSPSGRPRTGSPSAALAGAVEHDRVPVVQPAPAGEHLVGREAEPRRPRPRSARARARGAARTSRSGARGLRLHSLTRR